MAKRGGNEPGKKPARPPAMGATKVGSGFGKPKGDKPRPSDSSAIPKNFYEAKGAGRQEAPASKRRLTIKASTAKTTTKLRAKQNNPADAVVSKTKPLSSTARLEAALAHHNRPITTAEARRMNQIIKADRPVPELRPRRR